jgi:hypothetical protein
METATAIKPAETIWTCDGCGAEGTEDVMDEHECERKEKAMKSSLETTRERDLAQLAYCESPDCECYCSLKAVEEHLAQGHIVTWLRESRREA